MKILHISDYLQPQLGYQEYYLPKAQSEMGHDVVAVTGDRYCPFPNFEAILGERFLAPGETREGRLRIVRLPVLFEYPRSYFVVFAGLAATLRRERPDVVICHMILSPQSFWAARLQPELKYRLIFDNHSSYFNSAIRSSWLKRTYLWLWARWVRPSILAHAEKIVGIGVDEKKLAVDLLEVPQERVGVIPLGANTASFCVDPELRRAQREKLGLASEDLLLVHAGKLAPNKGVGVLIEAFASAGAGPAQLLIIGAGEPAYEAELDRLIAARGLSGRVKRLPFLSTVELNAYFNAADLGLWPGNPSIVIQEALCAGLPVIIQDHPTVKHLVAYENGLLVEKDSVASLTGALVRLTADPEARARMGQASRQLILDHHTYERISDEFLR